MKRRERLQRKEKIGEEYEWDMQEEDEMRILNGFNARYVDG